MTEHLASDGRCRHRRSWVLSGVYEWCYECGALRLLMKTAPSESIPSSYWRKPVGAGGENPGDFRMTKL